jgi:hypothetical protein
MLLFQLIANPLRDKPIAPELLVRCVKPGPVGCLLPRTANRQRDRTILRVQRAWEWVFRFLGRVVLVPRLRINELSNRLYIFAHNNLRIAVALLTELKLICAIICERVLI